MEETTDSIEILVQELMCQKAGTCPENCNKLGLIQKGNEERHCSEYAPNFQKKEYPEKV
jgi:hypothetical protein